MSVALANLSAFDPLPATTCDPSSLVSYNDTLEKHIFGFDKALILLAFMSTNSQ